LKRASLCFAEFEVFVVFVFVFFFVIKEIVTVFLGKNFVCQLLHLDIVEGRVSIGHADDKRQ